MRARSTRTVTAHRGVTLALTVLALTGWGAFAYSSWSAARTERAFQSQITRLNTDRTEIAPAAGNSRGQRPPPPGPSTRLLMEQASPRRRRWPLRWPADTVSSHVLRTALTFRNEQAGVRHRLTPPAPARYLPRLCLRLLLGSPWPQSW